MSWHGRIAIAQKGLDVLLEAWDVLTHAREQHDLVLLLTGSGQDSDALRAEIDRRRPRGVRWLDSYVLDRGIIRLQLAAADVAVFPSRAEGFAVAPLEAMASGRALVAAAVPGITELAPGGEDDGVIVVPPGDAAALASALGALLDDPERAAGGRHRSPGAGRRSVLTRSRRRSARDRAGPSSSAPFDGETRPQLAFLATLEPGSKECNDSERGTRVAPPRRVSRHSAAP